LALERDRTLEQVSLLQKENEELRKKLRFYENPPTPPSQPTLKKRVRAERVEKKRGASKGHRGTTKKHRDPDEVIDLTTIFCPYCNHELGEPIKTETKLVEDMPPPKKIKVTQFNIDVYRCPNCGAEVRSKHRDCPQAGDLGVCLLVYMTMLKYHLRGPLRKVRDFLCYNDSFEISPKGVMDGLLRVGDSCKDGYEDWEKLGDELLSKYWVIQGTSASELPEWWLEIVKPEPPCSFVRLW